MKRGDPFVQFVGEFLKGWAFRPNRIECLYELTKWCRCHNMHWLAVMFGKIGMEVPYPERDMLFVHRGHWSWQLKDEYSIALYWVGRYEEALKLYNELLASKETPDNQKERIKKNAQFAIDKLKK